MKRSALKALAEAAAPRSYTESLGEHWKFSAGTGHDSWVAQWYVLPADGKRRDNSPLREISDEDFARFLELRRWVDAWNRDEAEWAPPARGEATT